MKLLMNRSHLLVDIALSVKPVKQAISYNTEKAWAMITNQHKNTTRKGREEMKEYIILLDLIELKTKVSHSGLRALCGNAAGRPFTLCWAR